MNILKYVRSLLKIQSKDTILEDLSLTRDELSKIIIPSFIEAVDMLPKKLSKGNKVISDKFERSSGIKLNSSKNLVVVVTNTLQQLISHCNTVEQLISDNIGSQVVSDGVDSRKAILIRTSEQLSFYGKYSIDLISFLVLNEIADIRKMPIEDFLSPRSIKEIHRNIVRFGELTKVFSKKPKQFSDMLNKVPALLLTDKNYEAIRSVYGDKNIDPMHSKNISGFTYNPIYHVRLMVADYQIKRYKLLEEKKQSLELRLIHLKSLQEGNNNPQLEQEIEYTQNRIDRMEHTLYSMEQSVGGFDDE